VQEAEYKKNPIIFSYGRGLDIGFRFSSPLKALLLPDKRVHASLLARTNTATFLPKDQGQT
jgi:hypothetical protein